MKRFLISIVLLGIVPVLFAQNPSAYKIFTSDGKPVSYQQMINQLTKANVVFFGEQHNNPIAHWLELRVTKSLFDKTRGQIVQGAEMFEADVQLILNEYLNGFIREKDVKNEARVWSNYTTDYRPLLKFAHDHKIPFIATNIPRRYANLVFRHGFEALDSLSNQAKTYIAPLPIKFDPDLKCYKDMIQNMVHMGMHGSQNLAKAQAIKDATMAYFISKNLPQKGIFIHYNGAYHSDNHQGIVYYLKIYAPKAKILTISTVEQDGLSKLDDQNKNLADFIVVVPSDMTKTY